MATGATLRGSRIVLRSVAMSDADALRRILATPEVSARWREDEHDGWPVPLEDEETRWAVELDGVVVGLVQSFEEPDPQYRHAELDIFLDPAVHGRGMGREVLQTVVTHLFEDRGHHRLTIDPAADNRAAIATYRSVGFSPIGVLRAYERDHDGDGWHDGLLMQLVREDLRPPATSHGLQPLLHDGAYVFVTMAAEPPAGVRPVATVQEAEGLTLVAAQSEADAYGLAYDYVAAWITLQLQSALDAVGLTAAFSTALAHSGISCNVIAGARHDHLFVPYEQATTAMQVLSELTLAALPQAAGQVAPFRLGDHEG